MDPGVLCAPLPLIGTHTHREGLLGSYVYPPPLRYTCIHRSTQEEMYIR